MDRKKIALLLRNQAKQCYLMAGIIEKTSFTDQILKLNLKTDLDVFKKQLEREMNDATSTPCEKSQKR